jgi:hypothetical protein
MTHLNGVPSLSGSTLSTGYLGSDMRGYPSLEKGQVNLIPVTAAMNGLQAPASVLNRKGGTCRAVARLAGIKVRTGTLLLIKPR